MMKQLLIEEMKRAIEILENMEQPTIREKQYYGSENRFYTQLVPGTTELRQLLLSIRKHSILLEKGTK